MPYSLPAADFDAWLAQQRDVGGHVTTCVLNQQGFAHVNFDTKIALERALLLSGSRLQNRSVRVEVARPPKNAGNGGGGGGGKVPAVSLACVVHAN